eukprot:scaffold129867_cov19-Tisochrysis_lutea.AAC.1
MVPHLHARVLAAQRMRTGSVKGEVHVLVVIEVRAEGLRLHSRRRPDYAQSGQEAQACTAV